MADRNFSRTVPARPGRLPSGRLSARGRFRRELRWLLLGWPILIVTLFLTWSVLFIAWDGLTGDVDPAAAEPGGVTPPADVMLVMGTHVRDDGTPSRLLEDRLSTALALYEAGMADRIVVTSGRSPAGLNEAAVMAAWLITREVPTEDVRIDSAGHNTAASAANLAERVDPATARVIVVSQGFHLARVRLALAGHGFRAIVGVPAGPIRASHLPNLLREVAAFWWYAFAGPEVTIQEDSGPPEDAPDETPGVSSPVPASPSAGWRPAGGAAPA